MTLKTVSLFAALAQGAHLMTNMVHLTQLPRYGNDPLVAVSMLTGILAECALIAFLVTVYLTTGPAPSDQAP